MGIKAKIKTEARLFFVKNNINILEIRGRSMYPALQEGWNAEVSPVKQKDLRIGDIIVFDMKEELAVHRIVGKVNVDGKIFVLQKGDNESKPHLIDEARVVGKISRVFDCDRQEVPPGLWECQEKNKVMIFSLLNILYLILRRIKKIIFGNKKNSFTRFFYILYWRLFLSVSKNNKKI